VIAFAHFVCSWLVVCVCALPERPLSLALLPLRPWQRKSAEGRECQFKGYGSSRSPVSIRGLASRSWMKGRFQARSGRRRGEALNDRSRHQPSFS